MFGAQNASQIACDALLLLKDVYVCMWVFQIIRTPKHTRALSISFHCLLFPGVLELLPPITLSTHWLKPSLGFPTTFMLMLKSPKHGAGRRMETSVDRRKYIINPALQPNSKRTICDWQRPVYDFMSKKDMGR